MFKIITASYNCIDSIMDCLMSIQSQTEPFDVVVIDDASPGGQQGELIMGWCKTAGDNWHCIIHEQNVGALCSQVEAIYSLSCNDEDIIVFLDGDDKFLHANVLETIATAYADGITMMTYGSYVSNPHDPGCPQPYQYPSECIAKNDYRNARKWGIGFNHLRTMKFEIFKHLDGDDFLDADGGWYQVAGDTAVMIPCLELSGGRHKFITLPLVSYTSDSSQADWRLYSLEINRIHDRIFTQPRKASLYD